MKRGFLSSPAGIAAVACVVTGLLTGIVLLQAANPTPNAPEPWYSWFLTPGLLVGMILSALTGGVWHSWIPAWLLACAFYVANVLCWAPVAYVIIRVACHSCIMQSRSDV
jgi:hypothetical protein